MLQQRIQGWRTVAERPTLLREKPEACTINRGSKASWVIKQNNKSPYQCSIFISNVSRSE